MLFFLWENDSSVAICANNDSGLDLRGNAEGKSCQEAKSHESVIGKASHLFSSTQSYDCWRPSTAISSTTAAATSRRSSCRPGSLEKSTCILGRKKFQFCRAVPSSRPPASKV